MENRDTHDDPATPDFWDVRYREGRMPWDAGGAPRHLERFLAEPGRRRRVLIPGCGSAYEAKLFDEHGFEVLAIDFAAAAVERARRELGDREVLVRQAEFFDFQPDRRFDLIYERAFLCAIPPRQWGDYVRRLHELLTPGGMLIGFFYFRDDEQGPPWGLRGEELDSLLGDAFVLLEDEPVADSIEVFEGNERWQVWRHETDN